MANSSDIQVDLIKLISGQRMLRLTDNSSGLTLEKKLDADQPIVRQKKQLLSIFEAALVKDQMQPAQFGKQELL